MKLIPLLTGLSLFLSPLFARAGTNTLGAPVLQGTNSYSGVNLLTNAANVLAGDGSGITGLASVVAVAAGTNIVAVTNGQVVTINGTSYVTPSITNGLATTNYVNTATNNAVISASNTAWGGGTMTGPVLTLSSSQFSPAWNEFVTRSNLVNSLTIGSVLYNGSLTNGTNPYTMTNYTYQTTIPADFVRTYSSVAAGSYCGSVSATNLSSLSSPVISTIFLSVSNLQDATRTATFHCELYYSSNIYVTATPLTWYGDYNSQTFTVVGDSKTNTLQSLWTFPTVAFAPNQGVLWRVIKLDSYTGNQAPNIRVFGGTATPSQISFNTPASSSGVGILSDNNTWTGTNTFTNPIVGSSALFTATAASNVAVVVSNGIFRITNATSGAFWQMIADGGQFGIATNAMTYFVLNGIGNPVPQFSVKTNGNVTVGSITIGNSVLGLTGTPMYFGNAGLIGWYSAGLFSLIPSGSTVGNTNALYLMTTNNSYSNRSPNTVQFMAIARSDGATLNITDGLGVTSGGQTAASSIKVGIGTNSPQTALHVNGSTWTDGYLCFGSTNTTPSSPTTQAMSNTVFLYGATSGTNFAILKAMNGQGTVTVLSPHPQDGPEKIYTKETTYAEEIRHNHFTDTGAHEWINLTRLANQLEAIKAQLGMTLPPVIITETADDYYARTGQETPEVQQQIDASAQAQFEADALGIEYTPPDFVKSRLEAQAVIKFKGGGTIIKP